MEGNSERSTVVFPVTKTENPRFRENAVTRDVRLQQNVDTL